MKSKFSKVFYDLEDVLNYAFENDYYLVIEYRDDIKNTNVSSAHRTGLVSGDKVIWDEYKNQYPGMYKVRPVYRVRIDHKLDNAFAGIV